MNLVRTRKVTEAQFADCPKCGTEYSAYAPVPWTLSQTAAMHKRGCGGVLRFYVMAGDTESPADGS